VAVAIRVVTDSASDLAPELADEHLIEVVPLTVRFGDEELIDRKELSIDEFWRRLPLSETLPETAAPSAGTFEEAFRKVANEGADGIICISLSSRLSATMQSAQLAAKALEGEVPIEVVDSLQISMGLGSLCLSASRLAKSGASLDDIVADTVDRRGRSKLFAALDTLEYLKKGGRVGNARALLGSMLSIKPLLELRDGVVEEAGKVRTRSKSLQFLVDRVKEGPVDNLWVLSGEATDGETLLDGLDPIVPRDRIQTGAIGPVIGTHGGPGVIGVTFQVPR
jgi:DegV family protein with EDD domain